MNKQKFNLHTHTARCGHAEGLDIQYIHSAINAGLTTLGFSEHIPYPEMHLPACRMLYEQKNEYLDTIRNLQRGFQDKINIKVGYEVEYMNDHVDFLMQMKQECDYMILGQHCREIGYEYDCYCSNEDVLTYVKQIEDALELDIITYVAHPDYFMLGRRLFSEVCVEAAHRIARASILHDIPLEINLNGFHYGKKPIGFPASRDCRRNAIRIRSVNSGTLFPLTAAGWCMALMHTLRLRCWKRTAFIWLKRFWKAFH
ncbi:PHP domain-containing protein [[Clostridium] innocuum]|uniref:PHP domain-containing protein n=1 Tax=Clostridium innocuum TaxID=1522 RepID=UPI001E36AEA5|nr:PHP domain-containing protein [[Clostridium] innocuum]MCC2836809.1 PHP domain-containing protein [[Clostridium] innocuum]